LAREAKSDAALIAAALLHDIGHLLHGLGEDVAGEGVDARHEQLGYEWLLAQFGSAVAEPVRDHVAAKRYLCRVEPEYLGRLSPASVQSLQLQGGLFTEEEARSFEQLTFYRAAVQLRRWDDAAKEPGLPVPGVEEYRDLLDELLAAAQKHG
jgi:predicted HD phosphohydrolase